MSIFSKEKGKEKKTRRGRPKSEDLGKKVTLYLKERHISEADKKDMLMSHLVTKCVDRWIEEGRPEFYD